MPIFFVLLLSMVSSTISADSNPYQYLPKFIGKSEAKKEYSFAVHPLHNPSRLFQIFHPMIEQLNANIPDAHFYLEASKDYPAYDIKLAQAQVDFALPNPYQTMIASQGPYEVIAKMGDDFNFRGIILTPKHSAIQEVSDLKGKTISYPAPTALAATMMPQYFIQQHGVKVMQETQSEYVGSQESSIMNAYHGKVDAAATWPPPWELLIRERPEIADKLEVKWQTPPLPNNGVIVRKDVPHEISQQVVEVLTNLHTHPEGKKILAAMFLSKFEKADNNTYEPVRKFIQDFTEQVRRPSAER